MFYGCVIIQLDAGVLRSKAGIQQVTHSKHGVGNVKTKEFSTVFQGTFKLTDVDRTPTF